MLRWDLLFRSGGASMAELWEALAPWKDITIKSGLGWDMNHQQGQVIRSTDESIPNYERGAQETIREILALRFPGATEVLSAPISIPSGPCDDLQEAKSAKHSQGPNRI